MPDSGIDHKWGYSEEICDQIALFLFVPAFTKKLCNQSVCLFSPIYVDLTQLFMLIGPNIKKPQDRTRNDVKKRLWEG